MVNIPDFKGQMILDQVKNTYKQGQWVTKPEAGDIYFRFDDHLGQAHYLIIAKDAEQEFDLSFARAVIVRVLGLNAERLDWRSCMRSTESERTEAKEVRGALKRIKGIQHSGIGDKDLAAADNVDKPYEVEQALNT